MPAAIFEGIVDHRSRADKAHGESAVLAAIAAMPEPGRAMGELWVVPQGGIVGRDEANVI